MKRVLVVDDSPDFREKLRGLLIQLGFEPSLAADPVEAKNACAQKKFDLILCDLIMPVPDEIISAGNVDSGSAMVGINAVHELAKLQTGAPIVAMSGAALIEPLSDLARFGAAAALSKPFGAADLNYVMNRVWAMKPNLDGKD